VGESRNPSDPASYGLDPKTATLRLKFRVQKTNYSAAAVMSKRAAGGDDVIAAADDELPGWEAVLWRGRLYVSVTPQTLSNGSKEAFVSLLEYAEDVLECSHVIVCLGKPSYLLMPANDNGGAACAAPSGVDTNDKDIKMAIRNFMFLGFQPLAPGHEFMPSNPNLVCFYYTI